jgi:hypothetical protein
MEELDEALVKVGPRMGDQNLLSRAPPCFGRHGKQLVPAAFPVVSTHSIPREPDVRQAAGRKK